MKNILFSYPHSSLYIPENIKEKLNISRDDLILSMDFWTDRFFSWLDSTKLFAEIHFLFWNLNRHISGKHLLTQETYTEFNGLFPTELSHNGKAVYRDWNHLSQEEKQNLIDVYYIPYYQKLVDFIVSRRIDFVVDVHSCDPITSGNQLWSWERADIILWNLWDEKWNIDPKKWYITFPTQLLQLLKFTLEKHGLTVSLNNPFPWWNITQQIWKQIPTLQIEVNKRVYMSDDLLKVEEEKFKRVNDILEKVFREIV